MNPEIKAKWLTALRSGKYEQTTKMLHRTGNGYCCLGVLCDVVDAGKWQDLMLVAGGASSYVGQYSLEQPDRCYTSFPPVGLMAAVELKYTDAMTLSSMNDRGDGFEDIAHFIEKEL